MAAPWTSNGDPAAAGHGGKHWRIKNLFLSNGGGAPLPRITVNAQQFQILKAGEFNIFDDGNDFAISAKKRTERGSFELKGLESDGEKIVPYHVV